MLCPAGGRHLLRLRQAAPYSRIVRSILRNVAYTDSPISPERSRATRTLRRLRPAGRPGPARTGRRRRSRFHWSSPWRHFALAIAMVRITRNPLLLSTRPSASTTFYNYIYHGTYGLPPAGHPRCGRSRECSSTANSPSRRSASCCGSLLLVVLHLQTINEDLDPEVRHPRCRHGQRHSDGGGVEHRLSHRSRPGAPAASYADRGRGNWRRAGTIDRRWQGNG